MAGLAAVAKQQGTGLYNYSLVKRTPNTRLYVSEFQTESGELIRLDWRLKNRESSPFLDEIRISTDFNRGSYAAAYAMSFSWTTVQLVCFGVSRKAVDETDAWVQKRLSETGGPTNKRRFVKRVGAFEFLLELTPQNKKRLQLAVTLSRDGRPNGVANGWTSYCIH